MGLEYVDMKDVPEGDLKSLLNFMEGKTVPIIEGVDRAIYLHDYESWCKKHKIAGINIGNPELF
jgi:hypothetical protein